MLKFGRIRPPAPPKHRLSKYIDLSQLPPLPGSTNNINAVSAALHTMLGNDQYGDCVFAAGGHLVDCLTGNASAPQPGFVYTDAQAEADYSTVTGFNPNDPSTDNGANETDAFDYWHTHGFADGSKLLAYTGLDAADVGATKASIFVLSNVFLGLELPNEYVNPFPIEGAVWDVAGPPNPNQGHAIIALDYDTTGLQCITWGGVVTLTWAAYAKYCVTSAGGEAYSLLTADLVRKGANASPRGINWLDLLLDFATLGGTP